MATVAPASDQAADLLQKLSLDSQPKTLEVPEVAKKPSAKFGFIDGGDVTNIQIPSYERSTTPVLQEYMDPSMCYVPNGYASYYYGGYDGPMHEWDDYSRYVNADGVEMPPGVYGDNGSLMYHQGYGYSPYSAYAHAGSHVPTMGHDGQLYGPQHHQYPAPYYQPPTPPNVPNQGPPGQVEVSTSAAGDQVPLPVEKGSGNTNGIPNVNVNGNSNGHAPVRPSFHSSSPNSNGLYGRSALPGGVPSAGYQDPRLGYDGVRAPAPWIDGPIYSDGKPRPMASTSMSSTATHVSNIPPARNHNLHAVPHLMGLHPPRPTTGMGPAPAFMNRIYPNNRIYGNCGATGRVGPAFGSNGYDSRQNGRSWLAIDNKYRTRGRGNGFYGYGNEHVDGLNELNRGPRAGRFKNQKGFGPHITVAVRGQSLPSNGVPAESTVPDKNQYNQEDFAVKYSDAKCFVIKSYSEDDIHKSIKYNMWASTPSGNKKLDSAYQEAKDKSGGCPVFLFFSVNTSGQFVGLAEMVGSVDFNKNLEYWQQDKWNGCFPLKWHIIKDVPNSLLKHITLENNDNKPVTNSRDCQEIKLDQGMEMLKIFKDYVSKVCILDDFLFYEARQKTLQEKKAKQQQFQKLVWDGKHADGAKDEKEKDGVIPKVKLQKPVDLSQATVDPNRPQENGVVVGSGAEDAVKGVSKQVLTEKLVVGNGVAACC